MRKIILLMLSVLLILSVVSCGSSRNTESTNTESSEVIETEINENETSDGAEDESEPQNTNDDEMPIVPNTDDDEMPVVPSTDDDETQPVSNTDHYETPSPQETQKPSTEATTPATGGTTNEPSANDKDIELPFVPIN